MQYLLGNNKDNIKRVQTRYDADKNIDKYLK